MTVLERKWSTLHYELAQSGGKIKHKYWKRQFTTRTLASVATLILLSVTCLAGAYVLWFTATVNNIVDSVLTYREGDMYYMDWRYPQYTPYTRVYIYNYTNTEEFLRGDAKKLKVEEIGPYMYREKLEKVNVTFHGDGDTVSYREKRLFTFVPEESVGTEEDVFVVPNVPLLTGISLVRDKGFAAQLALRSAIWALDVDKGAFETLRVSEYLFGYNDKLYDAAQGALDMIGTKLPRLGMLTSRSGVNAHEYTIQTGTRNHSEIDVVVALDGKPDLGAWAEPECNRIDGAIGAIYQGPLWARERLHLYHVDLCRRINLDFQEERLAMGVLPAYRYTPPADFLHNARDNPENACFTPRYFGEWPSGVFPNAPCFENAPVFVSFPRFYQGDPKLRQMVEGVGEPEKDKHQLYLDLHPQLGLNLGCAVRIQANMMVRKAPLVGNYLDAFEDGTILPNMWFESIIDQYDPWTFRRTWHATFTLRWCETGFKYALPLLAALFGVLATRRMRRCVDRGEELCTANKTEVELQQLQQPLTTVR